MVGQFDVVLVDPPYVSAKCVAAFAATAALLARHPITRGGGAADETSPMTPCLFITSEVMREPLARLLPEMRMTAFSLVFQSKLSTPLRVYSNSPPDRLGGWDKTFDDA